MPVNTASLKLSRKGNWDFAKAVLMIIVIYGHVCPALSGDTYTDNWCALTRITGLFVMPLFFFISGYFQSSIIDFKGLLNKYKKSFLRLGVPMIAWGVVCVFFKTQIACAASYSDNAIQHLISFVLQSIVSSPGIYWYLSALMICVFWGSLLKLLSFSFPKLGLIVLLISLPLFPLLPVDYLHFSFVWFFYGGGIVYKLFETRIERYKNKKWFIAVIIAFSLLCVVLGYYFYPKNTFYYTSNLIRETSFSFIILRYVLCLMASICALHWLFRLFDRYKSKALVRHLTLSGQETLFIYCAHMLIVSFFLKHFVEQTFGGQGIVVSVPFVVLYIVSPIITLILYYILNQLAVDLKRFRVARVMFMGLPIK